MYRDFGRSLLAAFRQLVLPVVKQFSPSARIQGGKHAVVAQQITADTDAQKELRAMQEYLDNILSNLPVGVAILEGEDFRYKQINQRCADINGLSIEDHLGRPLAEILQDAAQDILPGLRRVMETCEPLPQREFSTRLPNDPDVLRTFIDSFFPIKDADGVARAVGAAVLEVTKRKQAEDALQRSYAKLEQRVEERTVRLNQINDALRAEVSDRKMAEESLSKSEARIANVIDIATDAIISVDLTQEIVGFNKAAETTFGYSAIDVIGQPLHILLPLQLRANHRSHVADFISAAKSSRRMGEDLRVLGRRQNGEEFPAEATISKVEISDQHIITVFLRDISEREDAEENLRLQREELAHALRVSTMGELTATLAHEINQQLTAIRANADAGKRFLKQDPPDLIEIEEILGDIINSNKRASEIIRHARALMTKQLVETKPLDMNEIVSGVIKLIHSQSVTKKVAIVMDLAGGLPLVIGDDVQLQQVCMNLFLNALDAMQGVPVDQRRLTVQTALQGETAVCVSIKDQGVGLDDKNADLLFTPFYTTKATGLGMGLSICRSIIEALGGKILRHENPGGGSVFQFTVPVVPAGAPRTVSG